MKELYGSRCGGGFFFWHSVVLDGWFGRRNAKASAERETNDTEQPTKSRDVG